MPNKFDEHGSHKGDNVGRDKTVNAFLQVFPKIPGKVVRSAFFGVILGLVVITVSKSMGSQGEGAGKAQLLGAIIMGVYMLLCQWHKLTIMYKLIIPIIIPIITFMTYPLIRETLTVVIFQCSTATQSCNTTPNETVTYTLSYVILCSLIDIFIDVNISIRTINENK